MIEGGIVDTVASVHNALYENVSAQVNKEPTIINTTENFGRTHFSTLIANVLICPDLAFAVHFLISATAQYYKNMVFFNVSERAWAHHLQCNELCL